MVNQKIFRTYEVEKDFSDSARSNQMPLTDQITEIATYLRTYFWVTLQYRYHAWIRGGVWGVDKVLVVGVQLCKVYRWVTAPTIIQSEQWVYF